MKRVLVVAIILLSLYGSSFAQAQQSPLSANEVSRQPTKIEITQKSESQSGAEKWLSLIEKTAWPLVAMFALITLLGPLSGFIETIGKRATGISLGGLEIKLPTMTESALDPEVLTFKSADLFTIVNDSAKRTLVNVFRQPGHLEYAAINLGRGTEWLSSRLFLMALMLQRMKSLSCIVFVAPGPASETQFVGATRPELLRWGLAMLQPWLELAFAKAYEQSISLPKYAPLVIKNEHGALDPDLAEEVVRRFLQLLRDQLPGAIKIETDWVQLEGDNLPEHATWISRHVLESQLELILWKDTVVESETKREAARLILNCNAPFVAKIKKNGEFLSLVDRVSFLDEFVSRVSEKLDIKN